MRKLLMCVLAASVLVMPGALLAQKQPVKPAGQRPGAPPYARTKKMTCAEALKMAPKVNKSLVPLDKAMKASYTKYKKHPKDAKLKKAYVDATYKYANTVLTVQRGSMEPPVQYRAALALYRKVLAVDPKHEQALKEKKTIEDIYKTMPGGIPK